jgi:hypothetical protein
MERRKFVGIIDNYFIQSFRIVGPISTEARIYNLKPSSFNPNKAIVINEYSVEPLPGEGNHSVINLHNKMWGSLFLVFLK